MFEIKKNGVKVYSANRASNKVGNMQAYRTFAQNLPLYVGGGQGGFLLENLKVHGMDYSFVVSASGTPVITKFSPEPGGGTQDNPITASSGIQLTFSTDIRKGQGNVEISTNGVTTEIPISDAQTTIVNDNTLSINPSTPLNDAVANTITMKSGVVFSVGDYDALLYDYEPSTKTQSASLTGNIGQCTQSCFESNACVAFIHSGTTCKLLSAYKLGDTHGVTSNNGVIFARPSQILRGEAFVGIEGPDTEIKSTMTLGGITLNDWVPAVEEAYKCTVANFSSTPQYVVECSAVGVAVSEAPVSRRLLSAGIQATSTITIPASAGNAAAQAANTLNSNLGASAGSVSSATNFVAAFQQLAVASGATQIAAAQLTAAAAPAVATPAPSPFGFLVSDSYGATYVFGYPSSGETDVDPSANIVLTFSEPIQAGTGEIIMFNPLDGDVNDASAYRMFDVQTDSRLSFAGNTLTITPGSHLHPGPVTVRMASGVVTDDPHPGTPVPLASPGIIANQYGFTVKQHTVPQERPKLRIGASGQCAYQLVHPWYQCMGTDWCMAQVKAFGHGCADHSRLQARKISYDTQVKISQHAFEHFGHDGAGLHVTFGNGEQWPEYGVTDMHED